MRAVVFERPHEFRVMEVADPLPGPGEVRVRIVVTGVCGTDRHLLAGGFLARYPLIPGHEIVGEVESLGDGVSDLSVGDLVAADNTSCVDTASTAGGTSRCTAATSTHSG